MQTFPGAQRPFWSQKTNPGSGGSWWRLLEARGYRVLEAQDGRQALGISETFAGPLHLLVTDVVMPDMNGPELAEQLKRLCPAIKVLYISGYAGEVIVQQGLSDAACFLPKPFAIDALARKVRGLLDTEE